MTASAAISLQQGSAARRVEGDILQALRFCRFHEHPQSSDRGNRQITDILDREDIGSSAPARATGRFSAEGDNNAHIGNSVSVATIYRSDAPMSYSTKGRNLPITPQCVEKTLGPIIRNRPVKAIAHAAGRSAEAVKKWRQTALPEAFAALVNLLTHDDEIYLAVMELAGRKPAAALTDNQKRALSEAMKMLGME